MIHDTYMQILFIIFILFLIYFSFFLWGLVTLSYVSRFIVTCIFSATLPRVSVEEHRRNI